MKRKAQAVLDRAHTLIILGVLFSLCVSENVGPRLLPFMEAATQAKVLAVPLVCQAGAAQVPSRGRTRSDRVEMTAPMAQRSSVERHILHLLAVALDHALYSAANDASPATDLNESSSYLPVFVSSAPGRAPPLTA